MCKVMVYRNGRSELKYEIKLTSPIRMSDIRKILESKLERGFNTLRLFNPEGVEITEDDLEFVKNGSILYASKG